MIKHNILQKTVKEYLEWHNFFVIDHVEHKKSRSIGIPDIQAFKNGKTIFIEIKVGRDKLRESQIEFIDKLKEKGINTYIITSIDYLIETMTEIRESVR